MKKIIQIFIVFLLLRAGVAAQLPDQKMLFIIDSVPILTDPEEWNLVLEEDISDYTVVKGKDSLNSLGWAKLDGITYIFTKEYRKRPDSIKKLPTLKKMEMQNGGWTFRGSPYTGKYIDYYNNGKIQNEGTLTNGKLNGELIIYFKNGNRKSVSNYNGGVLNGVWNDYYSNGAIMQTREYVNDKVKEFGIIYFINGQPGSENRPQKKTSYDTVFTYYSTGRIKQTRFMRNNMPVPDKKADEVNDYTTLFYQSINSGNLKEANKYFFKIWLIDSISSDSHFKEGLLLMKEFRFDDAIADFDKALSIEPLMREAFVHRALARIKKYKYPNAKVLPKDYKEGWLTLNDITSVPDQEKKKVCKDLQQARNVDFSEYYVIKMVPQAIMRYCEESFWR